MRPPAHRLYDAMLDELQKIAADRRSLEGDLHPSTDVRVIPKMKNTETVLNIQEHDAAGAGRHFDLRIKDPNKQITYSWALPKAALPDKGEARLAVRQPDHAATYLGFSGRLRTESGEGDVKSRVLAPITVHEGNAGRIHFSLEDKQYLLHRTTSNRNWLIRGV